MNLLGLLVLLGIVTWDSAVAKKTDDSSTNTGEVVIRILDWRPTSAPPSACCPEGHLHHVPSRMNSWGHIYVLIKNCDKCKETMYKIIEHADEAHIPWKAFDCCTEVKIETSLNGAWTLCGQPPYQIPPKPSKGSCKCKNEQQTIQQVQKPPVCPVSHIHKPTKDLLVNGASYTFTKLCCQCKEGMKVLLELLEENKMPWLLYDKPSKKCLNPKEIGVLCGWTPKPLPKPCPCGHTHQVPEDGVDNFESHKFEWGCPECGDVMHVLCAMAEANKVPPKKMKTFFEKMMKGLKSAVSYPSWYYST